MSLVKNKKQKRYTTYQRKQNSLNAQMRSSEIGPNSWVCLYACDELRLPVCTSFRKMVRHVIGLSIGVNNNLSSIKRFFQNQKSSPDEMMIYPRRLPCNSWKSYWNGHQNNCKSLDVLLRSVAGVMKNEVNSWSCMGDF